MSSSEHHHRFSRSNSKSSSYSTSHRQNLSFRSTSRLNSTIESDEIDRNLRLSATISTERSTRLNRNYPEFHIHPNEYELVFVNDHTSVYVLDGLLHHVDVCDQFSIDTESDYRTSR